MAMYRDYKSVDVSWVLTQTPVFDLPEEVNDYDDTFNVYKYGYKYLIAMVIISEKFSKRYWVYTYSKQSYYY